MSGDSPNTDDASQAQRNGHWHTQKQRQQETADQQ
jgi:hypothetical protein